MQESKYPQKLIAHCEEDKKQFIKNLPDSDNIHVLIGPEGDFSSEEIKSAIENKFVPISLGETRLRSETAGIVASSLLINK